MTDVDGLLDTVIFAAVGLPLTFGLMAYTQKNVDTLINQGKRQRPYKPRGYGYKKPQKQRMQKPQNMWSYPTYRPYKFKHPKF